MDINTIKNSLQSIHKLVPISLNEYEIVTDATFINGEKIKIYLEKQGNYWCFTDHKSTLKYMNEIYDLKAPDVKHCITAVIKIYGFSIMAGCLKCELKDEFSINSKLFDYIMCIGQLVNMYAFFDKPE